MFLNRQYLSRGGKDEKIFKVEREVIESQNQGKNKKQFEENIKEVDLLSKPQDHIKDFKEYEYFKE
jgi:hypothetical protein